MANRLTRMSEGRRPSGQQAQRGRRFARLTVWLMLATIVLATTGISYADFSESTLYSFTGPAGSGSHPVSVVSDVAGTLYGSTYNGGTGSSGTVFTLTPPANPGDSWTETTIYSFTPTEGHGQLLGERDGKLYGIVSNGSAGTGTFFALNPPTAPSGTWSESVLYRIADADLEDLVFANGVFYGLSSTSSAFNFFSLTPATSGSGWVENLLYSYPGTYADDGVNSQLTIGPDSVIYGTTAFVGTSNAGTVFALTPPATPGSTWTYTTLYSFTGGADGGNPGSGVTIDANGTLHGTTNHGGLSSPKCLQLGCGTVFSLTPPSSPDGAWTEAVLHAFTGQADGQWPTIPVVLRKNGTLFGASSIGGAAGAGTVFALLPPVNPDSGWTATILNSFTGNFSGDSPDCLIGGIGGLYGTIFGNGSSATDYGSVSGFIVTP